MKPPTAEHGTFQVRVTGPDGTVTWEGWCWSWQDACDQATRAMESGERVKVKRDEAV